MGNSKSKTIGEALTPCLYQLAAQHEKDLELLIITGINLVVKTVGNQ